jgi:hypothetical protein
MDMASADARAASAAGELVPAPVGGDGAGGAAPAVHGAHRTGARIAAPGAVFALQQVARRSALPPAERSDHVCFQLLGGTDEHGEENKYPYRVIVCGDDKLLAGKLSDKERTKKLKAAVEAAGFEAGGPGARQKLNFDGTASDTTTDINVVKAQVARWRSLPPDVLVLEHHGLRFLGELEHRNGWSHEHTAALRRAVHLLNVTLGKQQAWLLRCIIKERPEATLGIPHDACSDANGIILVSALEEAGVRCKRLPPWGTEGASAALRESDFVLHLRDTTAAAASASSGGSGGSGGGGAAGSAAGMELARGAAAGSAAGGAGRASGGAASSAASVGGSGADDADTLRNEVLAMMFKPLDAWTVAPLVSGMTLREGCEALFELTCSCWRKMSCSCSSVDEEEPAVKSACARRSGVSAALDARAIPITCGDQAARISLAAQVLTGQSTNPDQKWSFHGWELASAADLDVGAGIAASKAHAQELHASAAAAAATAAMRRALAAEAEERRRIRAEEDCILEAGTVHIWEGFTSRVTYTDPAAAAIAAQRHEEAEAARKKLQEKRDAIEDRAWEAKKRRGFWARPDEAIERARARARNQQRHEQLEREEEEEAAAAAEAAAPPLPRQPKSVFDEI